MLWLIDALLLLLKTQWRRHFTQHYSKARASFTKLLGQILETNHPLFLSNTRLCEESQYIRNLQPVFPCESPDIIETLWVVIPGAVKLA